MRTSYKIYLTGLMILALTVCLASTAPAMLIVDTGQPPSTYYSGVSLYGGQSFAGQFAISAEYKITSVQGWMGATFYTGGGPVSAAIFTDAGGVPGTQLYDQSFTVPGYISPAAWNGPTGMNWDLAAGTYWVVFAAISFDGYMPPNAPHPLSLYAFNQGGGWVPVNADYDWIGVQVAGDLVNSPAPLPGSALLLGSGFLGLMGWKRIKNS